MLRRQLLAGVLAVTGMAPLAVAQDEAPPASQTEPAVDADKARAKALFVIGRHIRAVGGEDAIRSAEFITIRGTFEIGAANFVGRVTSMRAHPPRLVTRLELGPMGVLVQGYDGSTAWTVHPASGPALLEGSAGTSMARNADIQSDLHYERDFETIEFLGDDEFKSEPVFAIRLVDHDGTETIEYFAQGSGLRLGVRGTRLAGEDTVPYSISLSAYEEYGRLKLPMKTVETVGQQAITVNIEDVSLERIEEDVFDAPDAVLALTESAGEGADGDP